MQQLSFSPLERSVTCQKGHSSDHKHPQASTGDEVVTDHSSGDEEDLPFSFNFSLVYLFVEAVKEAIELESEAKPPQKVCSFFPGLKKEGPTFPF